MSTNKPDNVVPVAVSSKAVTQRKLNWLLAPLTLAMLLWSGHATALPTFDDSNSVYAGSVTEGADTTTVIGALKAHDPDDAAATVLVVGFSTLQPVSLYGDFSLEVTEDPDRPASSDTAEWSYTLNSDAPDTRSLTANENLTFVVQIRDSDGNMAQKNVVITIVTVNNAPQIAGVTSQLLRVGVDSNAQGRLYAQDDDSAVTSTRYTLGSGTGTYGTLILTDASDGTASWQYSLASNAAVTALGSGERVTDTFSLTVSDALGIPASQTLDLVLTIVGEQTAQEVVGRFLDNQNIQSYRDACTANANCDGSGLQASQFTGAVTSNDAAVSIASGELIAVAHNLPGNSTALQEVRFVNAADAVQASVVGTYGTLILPELTTTRPNLDEDPDYSTGVWTYELNNTDADTQALLAGEQVQDLFRICAAPGSSAEITQNGAHGCDERNLVITITGGGVANPPVELTGDFSLSEPVQEDITLTAVQGALAVALTDGSVVTTAQYRLVDGSSRLLQQTKQYGSLAITENGDGSAIWSYTLLNARSEVQALRADELREDEFRLLVTINDDSSLTAERIISIAVLGSNDGGHIALADSGNSLNATLTEDSDASSAGYLEASGTVSVLDTDTGEMQVEVLLGNNALGTLELTHSAGVVTWDYQLDNANAEVQALNAGDNLTDRFTLQTVDGNEALTLEIEIQGSDEPLEITGNLSVSVAADLAGAAISRVVASQQGGNSPITLELLNDLGGYGSSVLTLDTGDTSSGNWEYRLDANQARSLGVGEQGADSFLLRATNEAGDTPLEQQLRVTVVGVDDAATGEVVYATTADATLARCTSSSCSVGQSVDAQVDNLADPDDATPVVVWVWEYNDGTSTTWVEALVSSARLVLEQQGNYRASAIIRDEHGGETRLGPGAEIQVGAGELLALRDSAVTTADLTEGDAASVSGGVDVTLQSSYTPANYGVSLAGVNGATCSSTCSTDGEYGALSLTRNNSETSFLSTSWTYTAGANIETLADGEQVVETFHVTLWNQQAITDGASVAKLLSVPVQITLTGAADTVTIIAESVFASVTEDENVQAGYLSASGQVSLQTDDSNSTVRLVANATPSAANTLGGTVTVSVDGQWRYQLLNNTAEVQALQAGESVLEVFTIATDDDTAMQDVTVSVLGANEVPQFELATYTVEADAQTESGTMLLTLHASDADRAPDQLLRYSIVSGNDASIFALDATSGVLTLADARLFFTNSDHQLTVSVRDEVNDEDTATILVLAYNFIDAGTGEVRASTDRDLFYAGENQANQFVFDSAAHADEDVIRLFERGSDFLDMSTLDSDPNTAGNQSLWFVGSGAFTDTGRGELRYESVGNNVQVQGDIDGNGGADFTFRIDNQNALVFSDFTGILSENDVLVNTAKTSNKRSVAVGEFVPYQVEIFSNLTGDATNLTIRDVPPAGFRLVQDSVYLYRGGEQPVPLAVSGTDVLQFGTFDLAGGERVTVSYLMQVGAGVRRGSHANSATVYQGEDIFGNTSVVQVEVIADPIFDLTTLIGKVYLDSNGNGLQDEGESGLAGVRLATPRGVVITTDKYGRYSLPGVDAGTADRGRNLLLKLDTASLPPASRVVGQNPRVMRITGGLMNQLDFGIQADAESELAKLGSGRAWASVNAGTRIPRLALGIPEWLAVGNDRLVAPAHFAVESNFPHYILAWTLQVFSPEDTLLRNPLAEVSGDALPIGQLIEWGGNGVELTGMDSVQVRLEVVDISGGRAQTQPHSINLRRGETTAGALQRDGLQTRNDLNPNNLPVIVGDLVTVRTQGLPEGARVRVGRHEYPVGNGGHLQVSRYLPAGQHRIPLELVSDTGEVEDKTELEVTLHTNRFFMVGLAEITAGQYDLSGSDATLRQGANSQLDYRYDNDVSIDGRVAFYLKGEIQGRYLITAHLDTTEDELSNLFSGLDGKNQTALFKRIDPDRYYPVYGDDSTVTRDVDTQGKLYVRVDWDQSQVLWGNYNTGFTGTELASYERGLYGLKLEYRTPSKNKLDEDRFLAKAFVAEPGTIAAHDEFLGTGGSLYYLNQSDVVLGSMKLKTEVRDFVNGRLLSIRELVEGVDYELDEYQGRLLLSKPLSGLSAPSYDEVVRDQLLGSDRVHLVADYEYHSLGVLGKERTQGARLRYWIGDYVGIGMTNVSEGNAFDLRGIDVTARSRGGSYVRLEYGETGSGQAIQRSVSDDGGLSFRSVGTVLDALQTGDAVFLNALLDLKDLGLRRGGEIELWYRDQDAAFHSLRYPTRGNFGQELVGVEARFDLSKTLGLRLRYEQYSLLDEILRDPAESDADYRLRLLGSEQTEFSIQLDWALSERLTLALEWLDEETAFANGNQAEDNQTTGLRLRWRISDKIAAFLFAQDSSSSATQSAGLTQARDQTGVGIEYQLSEKATLEAEVFSGEDSNGGRLGLSYAYREDGRAYANYTSEAGGRNETRLTLGQSTYLSEKLEIYSEHRYDRSELERVQGNSLGVLYQLSEGWSLGADVLYGVSELLEDGTQRDRRSYSLTSRLKGDAFSLVNRYEVRLDELIIGEEQQWVSTNRFNYRLSEALRLLAKADLSVSEDIAGNESAEYGELDLGLAYRPVEHNRFNLLTMYSYIHDLDPRPAGTEIYSEEQGSVLSVEGIVRVSPRWGIGGKLAYKESRVRLNRQGSWYDITSTLYIARGRFQLVEHWSALAEYRVLQVDETQDSRSGWLMGVDYDLHRNAQLGLGYNFTEFNDDLGSLDLDASGWFVNFTLKY